VLGSFFELLKNHQFLYSRIKEPIGLSALGKKIRIKQLSVLVNFKNLKEPGKELRMLWPVL
jgi:hypothetical protein